MQSYCWLALSTMHVSRRLGGARSAMRSQGRRMPSPTRPDRFGVPRSHLFLFIFCLSEEKEKKKHKRAIERCFSNGGWWMVEEKGIFDGWRQVLFLLFLLFLLHVVVNKSAMKTLFVVSNDTQGPSLVNVRYASRPGRFDSRLGALISSLSFLLFFYYSSP